MVSLSLLATIFFATAALANEPRGRLIFARQQFGVNCTSDDSCKKPCKTPVIKAKGIKVSVSEEIQAEARRRFSDAHCINQKCSCAITSDDQAQDFCKYWVEHDKEAFKGAKYVNGGVDADKGHILCVFAK